MYSENSNLGVNFLSASRLMTLITANLQPEALRTYHWCAGESSLAACVGADRLQDHCADVRGSSWRRAAVSGAAHLCHWPSQSPGSAVGCHQSLGCAICQTVNCRQPSFSGCRPPHLEFFTGARRHGSNTPVLQETLENVLTATIVLTSTSGPRSDFGHLGHYKN